MKRKETDYSLDGTINWHGIPIEIENKKGTVRSGFNHDGTHWKTLMKAHYGRIKKTEGEDGDALDVYIGDDLFSDKVFVVKQMNPETDKFDELKFIIGVRDKDEAIRLYQAHYDRADYYGGIKELSLPEFKTYISQNREDNFNEDFYL